mmetsp:Transcript_6886/g.10818  ORF Transcript_6886/g.10818 Transcript_6886/m.10818 type:complete len:203 (-) Transcript_6886:300-908(-)|eukprot:CAMPEP_0184656894 /NCGR_PEP_ID=MMETSP0308-20130426/16826_1 /TAXON_ID=38269 /ORGANISM="Gloeochaete witrockiana, Strain SAG 46.84" /LENGTH=202 /DNA_ID=CAMNT_0027094207 /DNA_START=182 /DNA_END=790 /DNA_ORIENTATION=-
MAPWRQSIAASLHRNRSLAYSRYAQLATVRPDGKPACRTLVFRGFLDNQALGLRDALKFITDSRSNKMDDIRAGDALKGGCWAELAWYFPKSREQYRFLGQLIAVDHTTPNELLQVERKAQWAQLSENARAQFAWPASGTPKSDSSMFVVQALDENITLETFVLLILNPANVDLLQLKSSPQNRFLYAKDTGSDWIQHSVNP